MKTFILSFKNFKPFVLIGLVSLLITSCGTHNKNDYDEADGIYSSGKTAAVEEASAEDDKSNYYKQYFKTKELAYKDVPEDDAILTDVEAYHTTESLDEDGYVVSEKKEYGSEYEDGYGAWGTNSTEVSINVYGGYGYTPFYGGWGIGFGWGYPYYGGGYYPYYGYGWGYSYPYPRYGYGYGYGGYYGGGYYGGGYYGGGYGYAYNRGRSNVNYMNSRSSSGRSSANSYNRRGDNSYSRSFGTNNSRRSNSYSRSESNRRSGATNSKVRPSTRPSYQGNSSSRGNTTRRSSATRSSTNTRSSNARPSSSSRSSSSYRGGSSRGGSSSGSRGGGRRGGL